MTSQSSGSAEQTGRSGRRGREALGVEYKIFLGVAVFFLITGLIYALWSLEPSGTVLLFFTFMLGLLPGSYLMYWSRHMRPRPEDRPTGTPQDSDAHGAVGSFHDSSPWPFVIGFGFAMVAMGIAYPLWPLVFGVALIAGAMIGVIFESRRGGTV